MVPLLILGGKITQMPKISVTIGLPNINKKGNPMAGLFAMNG